LSFEDTAKVPATRAKHNTNGGHPIYQRIGVLTTDEKSDKRMIDWTLVDVGTIAIE
jgi:hypothetical protein